MPVLQIPIKEPTIGRSLSTPFSSIESINISARVKDEASFG
ncbi:hypothetical protein [Flavobacterium hibernum]|nr:hypothetical protein [Flavobacterium hibernum]STO11243.1 Uncharacterised protein [Flavobacterium hibernum]